MTTTASPTITDEQATLLAQHAVFVQGGFSTPEIERTKAEADLAKGAVFDWHTIEAEVRAAGIAPASIEVYPEAPEPAPAPTAVTPDEDKVDVSHVLAHVDQAVSLRGRIDDLRKELARHEDAVKAALGPATEGTDAAGHVVVRYPHRSRHGLDKKAVAALLSPEDLAAVSRVTNYRTLLFGESGS